MLSVLRIGYCLTRYFVEGFVLPTTSCVSILPASVTFCVTREGIGSFK